jgi:DNA polymerase-3 subunit epsilon
MAIDISTQRIADCHFAGIDFESAGSAPGETDQPVQIGIANVDFWDNRPRLWESYIAVDRPVRWSASKVHGITTDMLWNAPSFTSLWGDIRSRLQQTVVIGHNPSTERRFLRHFPGHGFGPWIDTLVLARFCLPDLTDYSLSSVADALCLQPALHDLMPNKTWHDALFDATASLLITQEIIRQLNLEQQPLECFGSAIKP